MVLTETTASQTRFIIAPALMLDENQLQLADEYSYFVPDFMKNETGPVRSYFLHLAFFLGAEQSQTLRYHPIEFVVRVGGVEGKLHVLGRMPIVYHHLDLIQTLISKIHHLQNHLNPVRPVEVKNGSGAKLIYPDEFDIACINAQLAGVIAETYRGDDYRIPGIFGKHNMPELAILSHLAMQRPKPNFKNPDE